MNTSSIDPEHEKILAALLDDPDFIALSEAESRFNIFDALGTRRQELRHSDFLGYLLDPQRPHGLDDRFLRAFLLHATDDYEGGGFYNRIELRLNDFTNVAVYREQKNVDVLLLGDDLCVVIENKIGASESDGQLQKYREYAESELSRPHMLYLFLTPNGDAPTDPAYHAISHEIVASLCKQFANDMTVPRRTREALSDYFDFMEANVLDTSETAQLCRRIYSKHQEALDLLAKYTPNPKEMAREAIAAAIDSLVNQKIIEKDSTYQGTSRFWLPDKENPACTWNGSGTGRGVLYEWKWSGGKYWIDLVIGPLTNPQAKDHLVDLLKTGDPNHYASNRKSAYLHLSSKMIIDTDTFDYSDEPAVKLELAQRIEASLKAYLDVHSDAVVEAVDETLKQFPA